MGVVYLAWQTGLNRLTALKMILAGDFTRTRDRVRFRNEAEAVAAAGAPQPRKDLRNRRTGTRVCTSPWSMCPAVPCPMLLQYASASGKGGSPGTNTGPLPMRFMSGPWSTGISPKQRVVRGGR